MCMVWKYPGKTARNVATGASPGRSTGLLAHEMEIPTVADKREMIDRAN